MAAPSTGRGREATRQRLREAARAVFASGGLEALTMRGLAEHAECALGAVYTYFPDKDALLEDLVLSALAELAREVAARSGHEPLVAVTGAMRTVFGPGQANAELLPVLFRAGADSAFGRR